MTKNEVIDKYNDWFSNHEQFDEYNTCVKLNRSEFVGLVSRIYDDTMKDVRVDITPEDISPKPINAEVIDYTL